MSEFGPMPNHPEYIDKPEYESAWEKIRDKAVELAVETVKLGALGDQASEIVDDKDRPLVVQEMDIFRKVYQHHTEKLNDLFNRLGWSTLPTDTLLDPTVSSEDLVRRVTIVEFIEPFGIDHDLATLAFNEHIHYKQGLGGYGMDVEVGRDGKTETHEATEDEIMALTELIEILGPEHEERYRSIIEKDSE